MNVVAAQNIVETFGKLGFRNVQYGPLWTIANHYSQANSKLMVLVSHTSQHDLCFAHLFFGQTDMPVYIVTDYPNPITSFFSNNVTVIPMLPDGDNTRMIIEKFRKSRNFVLLFAISKPDANARIRSGYFYIAQQIQAKIAVAGFDYYLQECYVSPKTWKPPAKETTYLEFQSTIEREIVQQVTQICPLYPDKQAGFATYEYQAQHPEFDAKNIDVPDLSLLMNAVHGNSVSKNEILTIIIVTLIIVVAFVLLYILIPHIRKKKRATVQYIDHERVM